MRILIIRHADPEYRGDTLTEAGFKQAHALAKRLSSDLEATVTHIYSSPLGRARATALPTSDALNLPVHIEEWTRELSDWPRLPGSDGALRLWDVGGGTVRDADDLSVGNQWSHAPLADAKDAKAPFDALCKASDAFIAGLGYVRDGAHYRAERANRHVVAVFCHGGFGMAWLAHLLQLPLANAWASFYLTPSSVTTILFEERGVDQVAPRALAIGDVGHLYAEGLLLPNSKYEKPNQFGDWQRPSGIRANFF